MPRIAGPILLLSGKADELWPSAQMADAICERLRIKHCRFTWENAEYPDAGHWFDETSKLGGTPESNRKAGADARLKILSFLHTSASEMGASQ